MIQEMPRRPKMPTPPDEQRAIRQSVRWGLLQEEYGGADDARLKEWFVQQGDEEFANLLGTPDIAGNLLVTLAGMLTGPGLYGLGSPRLLHPDTDGAQRVADALEEAGFWSRMQWIEFLATGMGDALVHLEVGEEGLAVQTVAPQDVWIRTAPHDTSKVLELWHLRLRDVTGLGLRYCWDVYRLPGKPGEEPHFGVYTDLDGIAGADGAVVYTEVTKACGVDLGGESYPWKYEDGAPFIPYVHYTRWDTGGVWHDTQRRGITRASLNGILYWTYTGRAALDASHTSHVFVGIPEPVATETTTPDGTNPRAPAIRTIRVTPGMMHFLPAPESGQAQHFELGAGANLPVLLQFCIEYGRHALLREGISGEDYTSGPNPQSAGSMALSLAARRRVAERVRPLFSRRDRQAIRMSAALLRIAGLPSGPEKGYALEYRALPASPEEAAADRDTQTWRREQRLASRVDLYLHEHPGVTRAHAIAELRRIDAEDAALGADDTDTDTDKPADEATTEEGTDNADPARG